MKYNISNDNLSRLFTNIENALEENKKAINELLKIDYKYSKIKTNTEILKTVVNSMRNEQLEIHEKQKILINYNGDPCVTLNLSIIAILTKTVIILDFANQMVGINTFIVELINNILKDFSTEQLIYLSNDKEDKQVDKIICIDNINKYHSYLRKGNAKAKFYSNNYLDFYSDNDEFEEIEELIYKFSKENQIPIESYSELNIDDAIQMIEKGFGRKILILSNKKETKEAFEKNIKNKKLYINKNPFETSIEIINKKIVMI